MQLRAPGGPRGGCTGSTKREPKNGHLARIERGRILTPTQRTLRELKRRGLVCAVVEKWNPHVVRGDGGRGIRQDLFGFLDILALDPVRGVLGVQACGSAFSGHVGKLTEERAGPVIEWLRTPGTALELWGWRKVKVKVKRGGKATIWAPRVREFTLADFGLGLFE